MSTEQLITNRAVAAQIRFLQPTQQAIDRSVDWRGLRSAAECFESMVEFEALSDPELGGSGSGSDPMASYTEIFQFGTKGKVYI